MIVSQIRRPRRPMFESGRTVVFAKAGFRMRQTDVAEVKSLSAYEAAMFSLISRVKPSDALRASCFLPIQP